MCQRVCCFCPRLSPHWKSFKSKVRTPTSTIIAPRLLARFAVAVVDAVLHTAPRCLSRCVLAKCGVLLSLFIECVRGVPGFSALKTQIPAFLVVVLYIVLMQNEAVIDSFSPLPHITIGVALSLLSSRIIVEGSCLCGKDRLSLCKHTSFRSNGLCFR